MAPDHPSTHAPATPDLWVALDANDIDGARAVLDARPQAVHERAPHAHAAPPAPYKTNTPLTHIAIRAGRAETMAMLIGRGADVNALGYNENKGIAPAIVLAAWEGDVEMLRVLLDAGADPNAPGSAETALYAAIEHTEADGPHPNKVSVLLDGGARHDIFTAAMVGDVDVARTHATAYPPLLGRRSLKRNRTPLEEAAHYGHEDVAMALIELGSDVPAHAAAALGLTEVVSAIVDADPSQLEARDDSEDTPLMAACTHGRVETARALLDAGADANAENRWAATALTRAVAASDTQTVELLLSVGVDPAKPGRGGMLPVDHIATPDASVATRLRALLGA